MRTHWFVSIGLSSLLAVGLTLVFHPGVPAQESEKTVEIITKAGAFVFKEADVTIKEGQSIKWVSKVNGKHRLVPQDPVKDAAFKDTKEFIIPKTGTTPDSATQKFEKATTDAINYKCSIHPNTMKGTITVKK